MVSFGFTWCSATALRLLSLSAWLDRPVFEPLKDPSYFRRFFLDGGTVVWPNGARYCAGNPTRRRASQAIQSGGAAASAREGEAPRLNRSIKAAPAGTRRPVPAPERCPEILLSISCFRVFVAV